MKNEIFDYSNDQLSIVDVNARCETHITAKYSVGKQLTVGRTGTAAEKTTMHNFIDECRAWANSEHPKPKVLALIKPVA